MTSAVIIFLGEVLEAMLIISLLLAAADFLAIPRAWFALAIGAGLLGAGAYAAGFSAISDAFDGTGQERLNALLLFGITVSLWAAALYVIERRRTAPPRLPEWVGPVSTVAAITLAITRECSELYLYLSGTLAMENSILPVLLGGAIGTGIGFSAGALLFAVLSHQPRPRGLLSVSVICAPLAAGMASQAVNFLMQADVLSAQLPLWDTSAVVREGSVTGEILYALFAYEATPTPLQAATYLGSLAVLGAGLIWFGRASRAGSPPATHA